MTAKIIPLRKRNVQCLTVQGDSIFCAACGGVIPEGHKYWWRPLTHTAEHTNCEIYTPEYVKVKKNER